MTHAIDHSANIGLKEGRAVAAELSGGISSGPIYSAALAAMSRAIAAPGAVLDFGSGTGQLLPLLAQQYPASVLHAADIMSRPAKLHETVIWHSGDLNEPLPIADANYDLICAIEVIEHLENPRGTIREMSRLLRPGGAAVLTTPNTRSLRSLVMFAVRGHHAAFDEINYPAHITPVAAIDFERAGLESGLVMESIFYTGDGMIPKFVDHRWQALPLLGARLKGRLFSDNFGVVLRKP